MLLARRFSRHKPSPFSASLTRLLSSSASSSTSDTSRLRTVYNFQPPLSLLPDNPNPSPNPKSTKKTKPPYRPPSSLDKESIKSVKSNLPFDCRYSYTESNPNVRPIGLREPKYSPFGPGRLNRPWTGVCAPAVDPKTRSVDAGVEDPKLDERRRKMRERIQGERCQKNKTKRHINLGVLIMCYALLI